MHHNSLSRFKLTDQMLALVLCGLKPDKRLLLLKLYKVVKNITTLSPSSGRQKQFEDFFQCKDLFNKILNPIQLQTIGKTFLDRCSYEKIPQARITEIEGIFEVIKEKAGELNRVGATRAVQKATRIRKLQKRRCIWNSVGWSSITIFSIINSLLFILYFYLYVVADISVKTNTGRSNKHAAPVLKFLFAWVGLAISLITTGSCCAGQIFISSRMRNRINLAIANDPNGKLLREVAENLIRLHDSLRRNP